MISSRNIIAFLIALLTVETAALAWLYVAPPSHSSKPPNLVSTIAQSISAPFNVFNQPISNDTEYNLTQSNDGSWMIVIQSNLVPFRGNEIRSEAQIAIAPKYPSENLSIPTIIVQERGDGLLRIEYFAQNWNNTYGLVLYNSTSPSWRDNSNVTLRFISFGPPAPVNPQLAPRPNGNLTILVGNLVVLSDYPIAWANLSSFYVYGLRGSTFVGGNVAITVYQLISKSQ